MQQHLFCGMILYCCPFIILPLYTQTKKPKAYFSVLHTTFAHYTFPKHSHLKNCLESPQILLLKHKIVITLHFHTSAFIIFLEILMHIMPSLMLAEKKKNNYNKMSFWDASFQDQGPETVCLPQPPHIAIKLCRNRLSHQLAELFPLSF